jgi:hypothetical protein
LANKLIPDQVRYTKTQLKLNQKSGKYVAPEVIEADLSIITALQNSKRIAKNKRGRVMHFLKPKKAKKMSKSEVEMQEKLENQQLA